MNNAHLHLLLNHFPIVGNVLSILLLIWALIRNKKELMQLALAFSVVVGFFGYLADFTGDGAKEQVWNMEGFSKMAIHDHIQAADASLNFLYATSVAAIIAYYLIWKNKKAAKLFIYLTLILSLVSAFFLYRTGYLGGLIRHPEIEKVSDT